MVKYEQEEKKYILHNGVNYQPKSPKKLLQSWFYYGGTRLLRPSLYKEVDVVDSTRSRVIRSFS